MKRMFLRIIGHLAVASALLIMSSCEDKELVEKNESLRARVNELEKEVDMQKLNAGDDPGDQTEGLELANADLRRALSELERLDEEKTELEESHAKLERELRAYQRKYRIK